MSKDETGGGEGIEVITNEEFDTDRNAPKPILSASGTTYPTGQYTHKRYHLKKKVPALIRMIAPKGSLEIDEKAWNAFPYCRTVVENPSYMRENFFIKIESMYVQDNCLEANIHQLTEEQLAIREVVYINIADNGLYPSDYTIDTDPTIFESSIPGRGPISGPKWWENTKMPIMCAYKLVTCEFRWWGIQNRVESLIQSQEKRLFFKFHRKLFCWMDRWHGLSMDDIREFEGQVQRDLEQITRDFQSQYGVPANDFVVVDVFRW